MQSFAPAPVLAITGSVLVLHTFSHRHRHGRLQPNFRLSDEPLNGGNITALNPDMHLTESTCVGWAVMRSLRKIRGIYLVSAAQIQLTCWTSPGSPQGFPCGRALRTFTAWYTATWSHDLLTSPTTSERCALPCRTSHLGDNRPSRLGSLPLACSVLVQVR